MLQNSNMSDFKIIAIRPLVGCNPKYVKVLKPGQVYTFYNDYMISEDGNTLTYTKTVPDDLYNSGKPGPKINISAVVGKNGSGKSTISELFIAAVNNISYKFIEDQIKPLGFIPELQVEIFYEMSENDHDCRFFKAKVDYNKNIEGDNKNNIIVEFSLYDFEKEVFNYIPLAQGEEFVNFFYTIGVNYSHYALNSRNVGNWIKELFHKNDGYQTPIVLNPMRTEGNININTENHLVYSRLISNLLRTRPKSGSFDYRRFTENQYAKEITFKLNSNKLRYAYEIQGSKNVEKILTLESLYAGNNDDNSLSKPWKTYVIESVLYVFDSKVSIGKDIPYESEICDYIIKKMIAISLKYSSFSGYFNEDINTFEECDSSHDYGKQIGWFNEYLKKLKKDRSHVTFKLRQAINYLLINPLGSLVLEPQINDARFKDCSKSINDDDYLKGLFVRYNDKVYKVMSDRVSNIEREVIAIRKEDELVITIKRNHRQNRITVNNNVVQELLLLNPKYKINIDSLSIILNDNKGKVELIELIPPAIFDYDITLAPFINEENESDLPSQTSLFSDLSSGEKQLIHSTSSVTYHLYNLNSVFKGVGSDQSNKYSKVNICFDEIELYHHPDMQRKFIKYIIESIQRQELDYIEGINICFVTHSPFILSDIPESNILFLDVDKTTRVALPKLRQDCPKTFGANIHDLLKNGFFMKNGVMGEFAVDKINSTIQSINDHRKSKNANEKQENDIENLIEMLGEPLLKRSMKKLFYESFLRTNEDIDREIEMLTMIKKTRLKK